jgi:uncharacterized protein YndB with AHSA1/START domain
MAMLGSTGTMSVAELDAILIQVTVPLPIPMIFKALVEERQLEHWLCERAVVEPVVGGRYELAFTSGDLPFTSAGKVRRLTPDLDLGFSWQPPPSHSEGIVPGGACEVYVRLQESPEGIDVTFEHGGWKDTEEGAEARSWHFHLWDERLDELKRYLIATAYG